jgi:hypothetical protein
MIAVSDEDIINEALRIAVILDIKDFQASAGWFANFKNRYNISFRMVTSFSRKLTNAELDEKQRENADKLEKLMTENDIEEMLVFNMDEKPLLLDNAPRRTYEIKGAPDGPEPTHRYVHPVPAFPE